MVAAGVMEEPATKGVYLPSSISCPKEELATPVISIARHTLSSASCDKPKIAPTWRDSWQILSQDGPKRDFLTDVSNDKAKWTSLCFRSLLTL
jgi:hypothetical protein